MYQAFLPLAAVAVLAVATFRWTTEEMQLHGHLSRDAALAVTALVMLHALIVVIASGGGVMAVDVPLAPRLSVGLPLAVIGLTLTASAIAALGRWDVIFGARTDCFVAHGVYRFLRHPLFLGWTLALLGVAIAGASVLALVLVLFLAMALMAMTRGEAHRMTARFGEAYTAWKANPKAPSRAAAPSADHGPLYDPS